MGDRGAPGEGHLITALEAVLAHPGLRPEQLGPRRARADPEVRPRAPQRDAARGVHDPQMLDATDPQLSVRGLQPEVIGDAVDDGLGRAEDRQVAGVLARHGCPPAAAGLGPVAASIMLRRLCRARARMSTTILGIVLIIKNKLCFVWTLNNHKSADNARGARTAQCSGARAAHGGGDQLRALGLERNVRIRIRTEGRGWRNELVRLESALEGWTDSER
jgi:hypothetical protein